ncbi:arylmalonate decarboxylase [Aquibium sp. A9E412]|uniref:maleate cis-trans isomerase family protein n=1 Tax=Aquibium sp. A9E412 TaxID=2976767 RepID=UPI0025B24A02|nr:arylmalonate decarboxylase [Aquibium sp. A9E412]MDN2565532.1 arylmalonate decarboxylase [Aquibium sp. A9E412]
MPATEIRSRPVDVAFDRGRHWKGKLGFVVLAMEQTVEDDVFRMAPDGVGVHVSRMPMSNVATLESLASMAPDIGASAALLLPDDRLDVVCYTCNSGAMVIGEKAVARTLAAARPGARPTTVMTGVVRGLAALGARRIAVATPYIDEVNGTVFDFLAGYGFEIVALQGMNLRTNMEIDTVDPAFIKHYARSVDQPEADAVFVCCGALRALDIAQALEDELGKPVVVSNQAMMWDCLRLAGIDDAVAGFGQLMHLGCDAHRAAVARLGDLQDEGDTAA